MSAVLLLQRNERAAERASASDHSYWLADKEEAELMFNTLRALTVQLYRGSRRCPVGHDLDGVSGHPSAEGAAGERLPTHYERWQDTLDPVSVDRFNRFGWPDVFGKQEARA